MTYGVQADVRVDELRLYMDATISMSTKIVGLGADIIGANNKMHAALSKPLKGTISVLHIESLALLVGLCWAQNVGLPIKKILSDSFSLIQALHNTNNYYNELGILLNDNQKLQSNFSGASIFYNNRKYNSAAHNLGKHALLLD